MGCLLFNQDLPNLNLPCIKAANSSTLSRPPLNCTKHFPINQDSSIIAGTTQPPPLVSNPDNTNLIIGVVVGGGTGIFLLIFCVGALLACYLCFKRKKNYRKYVLPYRSYMDGESFDSLNLSIMVTVLAGHLLYSSQGSRSQCGL